MRYGPALTVAFHDLLASPSPPRIQFPTSLTQVPFTHSLLSTLLIGCGLRLGRFGRRRRGW